MGGGRWLIGEWLAKGKERQKDSNACGSYMKQASNTIINHFLAVFMNVAAVEWHAIECR